MKKVSNILWGIALLVLGIIIGLNVLGVTNIDIFFDGWWTLFIIVPSFIGLLTEKSKTGNIIALLLGVALLLCAQDVLSFDIVWKLSLPAILVIIGVSLIFKDAVHGKINKEIQKINEKNNSENSYCATFSDQNVNYDGEEFNGTTLNAVFGGIKCNLTNAIINGDTVINASSVFGGIEIYVPANIKVKFKSSCIFGGASDNRKNIAASDGSNTIYINATCIFGGVEVK